jgi:hypothetical protein
MIRSTQERIRHIVSLGSTFAAGSSIPPILNHSALRSGCNYPSLLAEKLGARLTDRTACGASLNNMAHTWQSSNSINPIDGERLPPQLLGVTKDTDLITITAGKSVGVPTIVTRSELLIYSHPFLGGQELGLCQSLIRSYAAVQLAQKLGLFARPVLWKMGETVRLPGSAQLSNINSGLKHIISTAKETAPHARIVLIDYLPIFGLASTPSNSLSLAEPVIRTFQTLQLQLNDCIDLTARETGVDLIRASKLGEGHELGTREEWITRSDISQGILPFMPNEEGMRAIAGAIEGLLQGNKG